MKKSAKDLSLEIALLVGSIWLFVVLGVSYVSLAECNVDRQYVQEQTRWTVSGGCEVKTQDYGWVPMHYFNNRD
jgi:heme/copper-type cytochrome/quinol oxidase subunit 1